MTCPEFDILQERMSQLGRFLDMPVRMPVLLRDAKVLDARAGFETGMNGTVTALMADIVDSIYGKSKKEIRGRTGARRKAWRTNNFSAVIQ